jgi:hypothetical protein
VPSEALNGALNEGFSYDGIIINAAMTDIDTLEHNTNLEHKDHRLRQRHEHTMPRREIRDLRAEIGALRAQLWVWQDGQRE